MGYYVRIIKSTAFVPAENLDRVYDIMCSLNETHDHEKHGGSWSGTKRTEKWFSWMDENYPETCKDAQAIFNQLDVAEKRCHVFIALNKIFKQIIEAIRWVKAY